MRRSSDNLMTCAWPAVLLLVHSIAADDVVILETGGRPGAARATGEIVEYTGQRLVLRHPGGREEVIESSRVVDVQTTWTKQHQLADSLFAAARFDEALTAYRQALADEPRGWAQRRILARTIWCLRYEDRVEPAIDLYLSLYRQDPSALYFDAIPLPWLTRAAPADVERRSRELLESSGSPVGTLIGASWLLPTYRTRSHDALRGLLSAEDPRVAFLAEAQLWRSQSAAATPGDVARWQDRLERMPREIQAGPTCLVAQVLARLSRTDEAALAFLRVPILHPLHRDLASHSLLEAARQLEKMNDPEGAARLYREVVDAYPRTVAAGEAQRVLNNPR
jgi:tetratricopeptide (TPR) repeat protein